MGSQLFEVLRQGIWASLTGGWFHDPRQPTLTNTIHLYLWLLLLALPLALNVYFTSNAFTWTIYTGAIGMIFCVIKLLNWRFHYLFDTTEPIEELVKEDFSSEQLDFNAKTNTDRLKHIGLAVATFLSLECFFSDDIELQVLDSSRSRGRLGQTHCLLDIEDSCPNRVEADSAGIGGNFKVEVHRNESSSSSPSTSCRSATNDCWKLERYKEKTDSDSAHADEGKVPHTQLQNGTNETQTTCSVPTAEVGIDSPTTCQGPSFSSSDLTQYTRGGKRFPTPVTDHSTTSLRNLKETKSLELGAVLSHNHALSEDSTSQQFRRTQSAQETSLKPKRRDALLRSPSSSETTPNTGCHKSEPLPRSSLQYLSTENPPPCLKRSKSEEVKVKTPLNFEDQESDNEDDDIEGDSIRCRTPLLQKTEEHYPRRDSEMNKNTSKVNKESRLTKKVSFTTQLSDEKDSVLLTSRSDGAKLPIGPPIEKKFTLVPSEELFGWNQSGGPFTSQWLFQAVNPMPAHRDIAPSTNENATHEDDTADTESLKSVDSEGNHSLAGISKLFEQEEEDAIILRINDTVSKCNELGPTPTSVKMRGLASSRPLPPKKPPRSAFPSTSTSNIASRPTATGDEWWRRQALRRRSPPDAETSYQARRPERETSPRVLERLLEEPVPGALVQNRDASSNSNALNLSNSHDKADKPATVEAGFDQASSEIVPQVSVANRSFRTALLGSRSGTRGGPTRGRTRAGREARSASDAHATSNPFLQSTREIKNHLRSLGGTQNSLDISGVVERQSVVSGSHDGTYYALDGLFRSVDESRGDSSANSTAVNRHRRLRRLAQTRRTLERRRDFVSGGSGSGPTHLANSHDDTSEGALHYFQDENGDWFSYTFSEKGVGSVVHVGTPPPATRPPCLTTILNRIDLGASAYLEPRAGPSSGTNPIASTSRQSTVVKTPSSSESWSSISSSELTVDPADHKLYSTHRRRSHIQSSQHPTTSPTIETLNFQYEPAGSNSITHSRIGGPMNIPLPPGISRPWQRNPRDVLSVLTESFLERRRIPSGAYSTGERLGSSGYPLSSDSNTSKKLSKFSYLMNPIPFIGSLKVKVHFDRLNLMAIFDRNLSFLESFLAILLAIGVASLGSFMLHQAYFRDLTMVLLCFVIASCQFSLLKSVQPDAASPTHGFNRVVAFSRPFYFCMCGVLVFLIQLAIDQKLTGYGWNVYNVDITDKDILTAVRDLVLLVILAFPLLFCVGVFPQVNTFSIFFLEQVDIHLFGGNAAACLSAVIISNLKNWIAAGCLYGFVYGALTEEEATQHLLFSIFCALLVPLSYHMSRCSSDATIMWSLLKQQLCPDDDCFGESTSEAKQKEAEEQGDPLPKKLRSTVNARLKSDTITCPFLGILIFALHSSTVFTALQPGLMPVLWIVSVAVGFLLHYVVPQMRKQMPCLMMAHPVLIPGEYNQFETREPAKFMWFEKVYVVVCFLERNILYPLLFVSALTQEAAQVVAENRFGLAFGSLVVTVTALKTLRCSYSDPSKHYVIVTFTVLFFRYDWEGLSETFVVDLFFMSIIFHKIYDLWLKLQFVTSYISPWQISWGSAFHAFAQPFSVPHSAMLFLQALISSLFSAPLNPFLGSAIFITSYVRPIKFWERDYNTKRVDHSNTRLASHLERNPGADDNNLNSIFYEHLTRSLQDSLCGDVALGRWGLVAQGDCFVLASDYLNCLVHVIEIGNGLVTFQMRGLEFRGTYCQQREVEAISEGVEEDEGCCCCEPGHLPHMLSANAAFSQRWLAWEVTVSKYVLEGYSIADNSAVSMLQVYDLRKILISYYMKGLIYYTLKAEKLPEWLECETIKLALRPTIEKNYADLDPIFNVNIDEDYDFSISGITRSSFCNVYYSWIQFCLGKRENGSDIPSGRDSTIVSLCFALSILARRSLGVASHSNSLTSVEFFLFGLHALFKGDFRITSQRDEWVFNDMDLLKKVVSPAVRMSLKLHQDHFMCPDEYDDHTALFDAISYHDEHLVISHEGDPAWRSAVLAGREGLLALRHVFDDGADEYKIIMLNKRHLSFRVIKLNRECVRGLWAGQQQELVYLRNRDPERGSIQNAKQALRNIINSSCDQPIGYPIYVSPLTTSYAETHPQLTSLLGGPISLTKIKESAIDLWKRIRNRCDQGCSSGSSLTQEDVAEVYTAPEGTYTLAASNSLPQSGQSVSASQSLEGSQIGGSSLGRGSVGRNLSRGSATSNVSFGKPSSSTLTSLTGFLTDANGNAREGSTGGIEGSKWCSLQKVRIIDANQVYDGLNMGRKIDVVWPDDSVRARGGRNFWLNWVPEDGMEGVIVHKWIPGHRDPKCRSITDKTILLLKIEDKFVPIAETGVQRVDPE